MKKYIFILGYVLCATVLSRFTQDQSLSVRHLIWAVVTLVLFSFYVTKGEIPKSWIFPVFAGYLVFAAITLLWATNPTKGLYEVVKIFMMVVSLVVVCKIIAEHKDFFIKSMTILGLVLGLYCLYEIAITEHAPHRLGTMGVRNLWASAQFLLLPICVYSIKKWRIIGICAASLITLNLLILFNRTSILALAVAASISILYVKRLRYVILVAIVIVLIICFLNPNFLSTKSLKSRYAVWGGTASLFRENPFFGIGINNWEIELPRYAAKISQVEKEICVTLFIQRPHNDYLWVLSETGIFGFACYISVFGLALFYAVKTRNVLALAGLSGYMVIAFFSFPKERVFHSMMLIAYLALALSGYKFKKVKLPRYATIPILLVMCFVVAEFGLCYNSEIHIRKMAIARDRKEWAKVLVEADKISCLRTLDPFTLPVKWYTGEAHYFLGNHKQSVIDSHEAFLCHPNNVYVLDRMGSIFDGIGDYKNAELCYRRALGIRPDFEYSLIKLGNLIKKRNKEIKGITKCL